VSYCNVVPHGGKSNGVLFQKCGITELNGGRRDFYMYKNTALLSGEDSCYSAAVHITRSL